jgi:tripartite-type tricarboxylate transporter receptor subunit TctC
MRYDRRVFLACGLAAFALSSPYAFAQSYPARPISLIVPAAAGGPTDTVARLVAESMSRTLGQTVVVENIGGAGGSTTRSTILTTSAGSPTCR